MCSHKLIRVATTAVVAFGLSICTSCSADYDQQVRLSFEDCKLRYDERTKQKVVSTDAQIQAVLNGFPQIKFGELDPKYVAHANLHRTSTVTNRRTRRHVTLDYRKENFYVIRGDDQFKYLVGHFRVVDFLPNGKSPGYPNDSFHVAARAHACTDEAENHSQYLLIDPLLLKKFNHLLQLLKKSPQGYDHRALSIYYGFRHPHMNDTIKGSANSQHLWGKALDMEVGDINRDGKINKLDKAIVLDFLERRVIHSRGGIGRYPDSPTDIHMDVRGWYARWDHQ